MIKEPERAHLFAVYMELTPEEWVEIVCPVCEWTSPFLAKKSTIDPRYLFTCDRNLFGICTARFSYAKVQHA